MTVYSKQIGTVYSAGSVRSYGCTSYEAECTQTYLQWRSGFVRSPHASQTTTRCSRRPGRAGARLFGTETEYVAGGFFELSEHKFIASNFRKLLLQYHGQG